MLCSSALSCIHRIYQWCPSFLVPGTRFVEGHYSTDWAGRAGGGAAQCQMFQVYYIYYPAADLTGWDSGNKAAANADGAVLTLPPLTSCSLARFLTGHRPAPPRAQGLGMLGTPAGSKSWHLLGPTSQSFRPRPPAL